MRCGAHALRSYAGATPIVYAYILTAIENYPLLRVVGEDHLDHDQISHLGHVNTRCATIRSQYRIAPRRLALYRAYRARAPHRAHRTVPHRTAPAYMYTLLSRFARRSVLIRYCFGTASVLLRYCFGTASVRYFNFFMTGTVGACAEGEKELMHES